MAQFAYGLTMKLSEHFTLKEFQCKCGQKHPTLISNELIEKLERLYTALGAGKGIVNSGYRCPTHDKRVGGSGGGQHTKGVAVDIVFYDKKGKIIGSDVVSCKAQDVGFSGIANIDKTYTATHLDVRTGKKWYGDETVTTAASVTNDFYDYYKKTRSMLTWKGNHDKKIAELQEILNRKGANLTVDGIAGDKTYNAVKAYTIEKGDSGELTKWTQQRLTALGYYVGVIDGICGDKTLKGISEFQKDNKLGVGYLGGGDWYYLIK